MEIIFIIIAIVGIVVFGAAWIAEIGWVDGWWDF